jgi:hypothetical protein
VIIAAKRTPTTGGALGARARRGPAPATGRPRFTSCTRWRLVSAVVLLEDGLERLPVIRCGARRHRISIHATYYVADTCEFPDRPPSVTLTTTLPIFSPVSTYS